MLPDPMIELTIAMEVDYFQLNRAEYFRAYRREDTGTGTGTCGAWP